LIKLILQRQKSLSNKKLAMISLSHLNKLIISVIFFIRDIFVSTETLKLHLSDMKIDLD